MEHNLNTNLNNSVHGATSPSTHAAASVRDPNLAGATCCGLGAEHSLSSRESRHTGTATVTVCQQSNYFMTPSPTSRRRRSQLAIAELMSPIAMASPMAMATAIPSQACRLDAGTIPKNSSSVSTWIPSPRIPMPQRTGCLTQIPMSAPLQTQQLAKI
jgi:hypothetical protein